MCIDTCAAAENKGHQTHHHCSCVYNFCVYDILLLATQLMFLLRFAALKQSWLAKQLCTKIGFL